MSIRSLVCALCLGVGCAIPSPATGAEGANAKNQDSAARTPVQQALEAQLAGDAELHYSLLKRAIELDPDDQTARGHLGQIRQGENWLTIDQATTAARDNEHLQRYSQMRDQLGASLQGQLVLAKYCQRNALPERAEMHWTNVVRAQPTNKAAMRALGLKRFRGDLWAPEQIEEIKQQEELVAFWSPRLKKWVKSIQDEAADRDDALGSLRALRDPRLIGALETLVSPASETLSLEVVRILGQIDHADSTSSLARHAIDSPHESVRRAATQQLKAISLFRVTPLLMVELGTPVDFAVEVVSFDQRAIEVVASYSVDRPDARLLHRTYQRGRMRPVALGSNGVMQRRAAAAARTINEEQRIAQYNALVDARNARVFEALEATTGEELGENPRAWWNWWREYNDYDSPYDYAPTYETYNVVNVTEGARECFAAGTEVWTETGPQAIEQIRVGDRVLTQSVATAGLQFHVVLQVTQRPANATRRIQVAEEEILATNGHPLWVAGKGWRMAKNLQVGDRLYGLSGLQAVSRNSEGPGLTVYNMVVAGSDNNYFIGKHRLLTHDATLRQPTRNVLPSLAGK